MPSKRANYRILNAYLGGEFFLSFLVSFLFFFFIFFVNQILLIAKDILEKSAPVTDVLLLLLFAMPMFVAMSFPFATLVGTLMSVGRMSADSEIIVFQASGVSLKRVFMPFLAIGLVVSGASFVMNDIFLPLGTVNYYKLYRKLLASTPALELKPYSVKKYQNLSTTIVTGDVTATEISDLVIFDVTEERKNRVITAKKARMVDSGEKSNSISLRLEDVFLQVSDPKTPDKFDYSVSEKMEYNILLKELVSGTQSIGPSQMSSVDVAKVIREKEIALERKTALKAKEILAKRFEFERQYRLLSSRTDLADPFRKITQALSDYREKRDSRQEDKSIGVYQLEFHKKFSIPAGAFFFVLFAFPVGIKSRRSGRSAGVTVGLIVATLYWFSLVAAQNFAPKLGMDPFLAMWLPDMAVFAAAVFVAVARFVL